MFEKFRRQPKKYFSAEELAEYDELKRQWEKNPPLVPSAIPWPKTPAHPVELFGRDALRSEVLPAYYDTPYDPSSGIPSTEEGAPIGEDARLFWETSTGRKPLIQVDRPRFSIIRRLIGLG